ncbi:MAG: S-layer homology domain-containing protein [Candidatus Peregrinibacteria bacterium]
MSSVLLNILTSLLLAFPVASAALPEPFVDVLGHPHASQIEFLHARGVVSGYGYDIFRPDILINRAEFLKILMLASFGKSGFEAADHKCFRDFTGREQWYWVYACAARERGVIDGYPDGTFRGTDTIILAEALKMTANAWKMPLPAGRSGSANWYDPYFDLAASKRIFSDFPAEPDHLLTRSEMAVLLISMGGTIGHAETVVAIAQFSSSVSSLSVPVLPPRACGNGFTEEGEQCDDGNLVDGDGCSKICIIVPEPIRHGVLKIEQRPFASLEQAQGSKDIVVFAFDAVAGQQDVIMTGMKFRSTTGDLNKAQNYRLRAAGTANASIQQIIATANPVAGIVSFSNMFLLVQDGVSRRVELVADLNSNVTPESVSVGFALLDPRYVEAVGTEDWKELTGIETDSALCAESMCWIAVLTQSDRPVEILSKGSLFVTADTVPVSSHQILPGERSPVLLRLKFRATGEDISVTEMAITGVPDAVDHLEFTSGSSSEPFALGSALACTVQEAGRFCTRASLIIGQDSSVTVLVRAVLRSQAPEDLSGTLFALTMTDDAEHPAVEAQGVGSVQNLLQNDGDGIDDGEIFVGTSMPGPNQEISGPVHEIVAAKILSIENASREPEGGIISAGSMTVGMFRFTAVGNASEPIVDPFPVRLRSIRFTINAQNVDIDPSSFSLMNTENASATKSCSANLSTGVIEVTCSSLEGSSIGTYLNPGKSVKLSLQANIRNPHVGNGAAMLQTSLQNFGSPEDAGSLEWDDGVTTFEWLDISKSSVRGTMYRLP